MSLGTILFVRIFGALLPPPSDDDREYYEILGLPKNASEEEIRKAYRSKSLKLHPDKIAQRRETNVEEAKVEYQFVQEANSVLSDKKKRQKYHAVGCSPTRYQFLTKDGFTNQSAVLENLHNASFADKTRLVMFLAFFPTLLLVQPILIAAKINQIIAGDGRLLSVSWMVLLIPLWIMHSLVILFELLLIFFVPDDSLTTRLTLLVTMLESMAWLAANMVLALKWDGEISSSYIVVFIPVYITLVLKIQRLLLTGKSLQDEMAKMVSEHKFQTEILQGRQPEELDEDELKEIASLYVIVHVPIEVEAQLMLDQDIPDEAKEEIRVAASHEFQISMDMYADTRADLRNTVIFGIPFLILVILKLDSSSFTASWWIVFLPIWISLGGKFLWGCFSCCVGSSTEEAPVLVNVSEEEAEGAETTQDGAPTASEAEDKQASAENGDGGGTAEGAAATDQATDETQASSEDQVPSTTADETEPTEAAGLSALNNEGNTEQTPIYSNEKEKYNSTSMPEDPSSAKQTTSDDAPTEEAKSADDEDAEMDEEAFNEWQRANAEGDVSAMRAQSKATQNCASGCCQTLFLVLVVAKLEQAYEFEREDIGDGGFNTMWLLTPLFVVVGIMLCCCACLVYGAPSPEEVWNSQNQEDNEEGDPESPDDTTPIISMPPPVPDENDTVPETAAAVDEPKESTDEPPATTESSDIQQPEIVEQSVETDGDMHELD